MRPRRRFAPIQPAPWAPQPKPPASPEQIQASIDRRAQEQARAWGADIEEAIERLSAALEAKDATEVYRDRSDPWAARRYEEKSNLLRLLLDLKRRSVNSSETNEVHQMNIMSQFENRYYKAADLGGSARRATIAGCEVEDLGEGEHKPVLRFVDKPKGVVLNRTNAEILASLLGPETTAWVGREIELYPDKTMFNGRMVDCLRVRVPTPAAQHPSDESIPW
jgi:hypothetical protein